MEGRSVYFSAGARCHYLNGSKEMTLNELPLRELHSEVKALRGLSEQLETVLPFGRFRKLVLYSASRKLQATWLGLAVAHAFLNSQPGMGEAFLHTRFSPTELLVGLVVL